MRITTVVLLLAALSCLRIGTDSLKEADECRANADCSAREVCVFGRCVIPCTADSDCEGDGARCLLGTCVVVPIEGGCVCGPLPPPECVDASTYRTYRNEPFCVDEDTCEYPYDDVDCPNCLAACLEAQCGDGEQAPSEECDDGDANSDTVADACRTDCTAAGCGDGVLDTGETCDDGNDDNSDACPQTCLVATCGDGFARQDPISIGMGTFEQCDDGPANDDDTPDACRTDCTLAHCGDGVSDTGELCDDGNQQPFDGCSPTCDFIAWTRELPAPATVVAPLSIWKGSTITSTYNIGVVTLEGDLRVYNAATGSPTWSYNAPGESFSAPAIKPSNILVEIGYIADFPFLYLLSDAGRIHALHASYSAGNPRWTLDLGAATNGSWLSSFMIEGLTAIDQTGHLHLIYDDGGDTGSIEPVPSGYNPAWLDGPGTCTGCRPTSLTQGVVAGVGTDLILWDLSEDTAGTGYCAPTTFPVPEGGHVVGHVAVIPGRMPEAFAVAATSSGWVMCGGKDIDEGEVCDVPATIAWSYDTQLTLTGSPVLMSGSGSMPIVFPDGPITTDGDVAIVVVSQEGVVVWLDSEDGASPTETWRTDLGAPIGASAAVDALGTIYVSTSDGRVHALRADDGGILWSVLLEEAAVGSPVVEGGGVFVVTGGGTLYALERGGVAPSPFWWSREGGDNNNSGLGLFVCGASGTAPILGILAAIWVLARARRSSRRMKFLSISND